MYRAYSNNKMYYNLDYITMTGGGLANGTPLIRPVLMQHIGVLDKSSKKIYADDFVRFGDRIEIVEYDLETAQWSICADLCGIRLMEGSNKRRGYEKWKLNYPEVVGNKWENPELLDKIRKASF